MTTCPYCGGCIDGGICTGCMYSPGEDAASALPEPVLLDTAADFDPAFDAWACDGAAA